MGHEIRHESFSLKLSKKEIEANCNETCAYYSDYKGSSLYNGIEFKDNLVFNDRDEADNWIDEHDQSYWNVAVKYHDFSNVPAANSKKLENLKSRVEKERQKLYSYAEAHSVTKFKSAYVGCPECGSKLNKEKLHSDVCPLCGTDLRSKTTLETLERYKQNIKDLEKEIKAETKKINLKRLKKSEIKWLVKYEYHV